MSNKEIKQEIIDKYSKTFKADQAKGMRYIDVKDVSAMLDEYYGYQVFLYDSQQ